MSQITRKYLLSFERDGVCFKCNQSFYVDDNGEEYESGDLIDSNLLARQDAFRKAKNLLTSSDIISIRRRIGLSQKDFAKMLGLGEVDIVRYETKAVQSSVINDVILRSSDDLQWLIERFTSYSDKLSEKKRVEVKKNIEEMLLDQSIQESSQIRSINAIYFPYGKYSINSGFKDLDIKAVSSIVFLLKKGGIVLYKTLLAKCLYYIDNLYFRKTGKGITGLVYAHRQFGALPLAFGYILETPSFKVTEGMTISPDGQENHTYVVSSEAQNFLDSDQTDFINGLIPSLKKFSAVSIVKHMHQEESFKKTKNGQIISYEYAKSLHCL